MVREQVDMLFLQEVPSAGWLDRWEGSGYRSFTQDPASRSFRCRSAMVVRDGVAAEPFDLPTAGYHGSYVAAASVDLPGVGNAVCVSVHASPSKVGAADLALWPEKVVPRPTPRRGGGRDAGTVWDADRVLATLRQVQADGGHVLAAGDLNEARGWDSRHAGEMWGSEYFDLVARSGLSDCCCPDGTERVTRGHYHLDHVLGSKRVAPRIGSVEIREAVGSDHQPLAFDITAP